MTGLTDVDFMFIDQQINKHRRIMGMVIGTSKNGYEPLKKEILENQAIVKRLKDIIRQMELAEVDVQNWLSEKGHTQHTLLLDYLKREILNES